MAADAYRPAGVVADMRSASRPSRSSDRTIVGRPLGRRLASSTLSSRLSAGSTDRKRRRRSIYAHGTATTFDGSDRRSQSVTLGAALVTAQTTMAGVTDARTTDGSTADHVCEHRWRAFDRRAGRPTPPCRRSHPRLMTVTGTTDTDGRSRSTAAVDGSRRKRSSTWSTWPPATRRVAGHDDPHVGSHRVAAPLDGAPTDALQYPSPRHDHRQGRPVTNRRTARYSLAAVR